jgi:hypothetical protein
MAKYKKIIELKNGVEADLMTALLEERNIPHLVRSYHDSAYDGIFQVQMGWGHIEAPPEYQQEIERVYQDLEETRDS